LWIRIRYGDTVLRHRPLQTRFYNPALQPGLDPPAWNAKLFAISLQRSGAWNIFMYLFDRVGVKTKKKMAGAYCRAKLKERIRME
jgi:hypothetical protein